MKTATWKTLGAALVSLLVGAAGSCGSEPAEQCGPGICDGCCDATGACRPGAAAAACGHGGYACFACEAAQTCQQGLCAGGEPDGGLDSGTSAPLDAGVNAGADGGLDAGVSDGWRSVLYPVDWTPSFTGAAGRFLHDFSYAGYRRSEVPLPAAWGGLVADVTSYGAAPGTANDSAPAFAAAIAAVEAADGGVVYVPDGEYVLASRLTIHGSHVLLRGQSRAGTKLHFTSTAMNGHQSIVFAGAPAPATTAVPLIADGVARSHQVQLADASGFQVGDDVFVELTITQAFVDRYSMHGLWDTGSNSALGARKVFFRREITAIAGGVVSLDVPLRMTVRVSDGASLRLDTGALSECGVEHLSLNNAIAPSAANANPRAHVLGFSHVKDCFVRDVGSYASTRAPDANSHLQSGGIYLASSKRVTVENTSMAHAQNHGDGGAGYGFEASMSNEILFKDDQVSDVRHGFIQNWDFGSSGLVWLRCDAQGDVAVNNGIATPGRSEFHHRLSMASLFDSCHDSAGFAAYNRGSESSSSGHAATENVFWNVSGDGSSTRLSSYQYGTGYIIGTRAINPLIEPDLIDSFLGYAKNTAPTDHLEGKDDGARLRPSSLFEDQLARRLALP